MKRSSVWIIGVVVIVTLVFAACVVDAAAQEKPIKWRTQSTFGVGSWDFVHGERAIERIGTMSQGRLQLGPLLAPGTIVPAYENLLREIMHNAVAAATEDPRFPPVRQEELEGLVISVDVLSEPETVSSIDELDPKRYGVIVAKGHSRGVLLPDLEGVDTPQEQLSIAAQKAGIRSLEGATVYRFTVERYEEA